MAASGDSSSYNCFKTPANVPDILIVSGIDPIGNVLLPWSNFGECVTLKAPGILNSVSIDSDELETTVVGSSAAAALVSGLVAILADGIASVDGSENFAGVHARRTIENMLKQGSTAHYLPENDPNIHKFPYVPCKFVFEKSLVGFINEMVKSSSRVSSHVFNHFQRVRKQFMESRKHKS